MITPEQAAEAVKQKNKLYRLRTYTDSAGTPVPFFPIAVSFTDGRWIAIERYARVDATEEYQELTNLYANRTDALNADAVRLERAADKCKIEAQKQRNAAIKASTEDAPL